MLDKSEEIFLKIYVTIAANFIFDKISKMQIENANILIRMTSLSEIYQKELIQVVFTNRLE